MARLRAPLWAINGGRLVELRRDWAVVELAENGSQRIIDRRRLMLGISGPRESGLGPPKDGGPQKRNAATTSEAYGPRGPKRISQLR